MFDVRVDISSVRSILIPDIFLHHRCEHSLHNFSVMRRKSTLDQKRHTKTPPQKRKNTTKKTQKHTSHHHKNTTTNTPPQKHHHTTTKTQPQTHHHKNTTTLPQKHHTKTPPQKPQKPTTPPQKHHEKSTTTQHILWNHTKIGRALVAKPLQASSLHLSLISPGTKRSWRWTRCLHLPNQAGKRKACFEAEKSWELFDVTSAQFLFFPCRTPNVCRQRSIATCKCSFLRRKSIRILWVACLRRTPSAILWKQCFILDRNRHPVSKNTFLWKNAIFYLRKYAKKACQ